MHLDETMIKYLEQQCLMSELQDIVTDLSPDVDHGLDQPGFAKTLGMHQQADVLASLSKHLQAAALAQQLQLPAATVQHFNKSHEDSAQGECLCHETAAVHRSGLIQARGGQQRPPLLPESQTGKTGTNRFLSLPHTPVCLVVFG